MIEENKTENTEGEKISPMDIKTSSSSLVGFGRGVPGRPMSAPPLPVGVWATLKSLKLVNTARMPNGTEKLWYSAPDYKILLLTNRTVKIRDVARAVSVYTPLENVVSYEIDGGSAFEDRIQQESD